MDYMCEDDGDKLASFYENGGFDCFNESELAILECREETVAKLPTSDFSSIDRNFTCKWVGQICGCDRV